MDFHQSSPPTVTGRIALYFAMSSTFFCQYKVAILLQNLAYSIQTSGPSGSLLYKKGLGEVILLIPILCSNIVFEDYSNVIQSVHSPEASGAR